MKETQRSQCWAESRRTDGTEEGLGEWTDECRRIQDNILTEAL